MALCLTVLYHACALRLPPMPPVAVAGAVKCWEVGACGAEQPAHVPGLWGRTAVAQVMK